MKSEWTLGTCKNKHKTCDHFEKSADEIFEVIQLLEEQFEISTHEPHMASGPDTTVFPLNINEESILIGWDHWSGLFIMSATDKGDIIIELIYHYLKNFEK